MSEIVKEVMLIKVDMGGNNNKFYHVTLFDNNEIHTRWGRVGSKGTTSIEHAYGPGRFDTVVNGKKRKGYKETDVISDKSNAGINKLEMKTLAQRNLVKGTSEEVNNLITRLVDANRHSLIEQSGGLIKISDTGQVTTPLGLISRNNLKEAQSILAEFKTIKKQGTRTREDKIEEYLTLVPQKLARGWQDSFLTNQDQLTEQVNLIDQLSNSIDWYEATGKKLLEEKQSNQGSPELDFRMKLSHLNKDTKAYKAIEEYYLQGRNKVHRYSYNARLSNVYILDDTQGIESWRESEKNYGNVKQLWHGTGISNVLSILAKGLFVPKANSGIHITGRMFGDGLYFSDQSTKSLNYATSYWGGDNSKQCYMLLNDIVMGHEFKPKYWNHESEVKAKTGVGRFSKKPYQSINVQGGTCGVVNNEMIIWNSEQINVRYLCEFTL